MGLLLFLPAFCGGTAQGPAAPHYVAERLAVESGDFRQASDRELYLYASLLVKKLSRDSPLKVLLTDLPNLPTQLGRHTARPRSRRRMGRPRPGPAAPAAPAAWTPAT